jgi:SAM-dependent methyltransferase
LRRWIYAELKNLPCNSTILDVGCRDASLTRLLAKYSSNVTALDSSGGQLAQNARSYPEIRFLQHDMSDPIPFMDGTFDIIWCSGVLEHVPNPGFVLREMYRGLTPGGRLLVSVPYNSWFKDLLVTLFDWGQHFTPANSSMHFFTQSSLEKIARNAGFTSLHLKTCRIGNPLRDPLIPTHIVLRAEKSLLAPFSVTFSRSRRDQSQIRPVMAVSSQATAHNGPGRSAAIGRRCLTDLLPKRAIGGDQAGQTRSVGV